MTVKSCEKLEKSRVALTIETSAEEFEAAVNKAYLKMRGKINVPGFRVGKAPRKIIEKMYGAEVFYEEAVNIILPGESFPLRNRFYRNQRSAVFQTALLMFGQFIGGLSLNHAGIPHILHHLRKFADLHGKRCIWVVNRPIQAYMLFDDLRSQ